MPQTKEIRILKHFRVLMNKQRNLHISEGFNLYLTREEYKKLCADSYNETILFLARHWKMKCSEIKATINTVKENPVKYDSRKTSLQLSVIEVDDG